MVPAAHADTKRGVLDEPKLFRCLIVDLGAEEADGANASVGSEVHSVGRRLEQFEQLRRRLVGAAHALSEPRPGVAHSSPRRRLQELEAAVAALDKDGGAASVTSAAVAEVPFPQPGIGWPVGRRGGQSRTVDDCRHAANELQAWLNGALEAAIARLPVALLDEEPEHADPAEQALRSFLLLPAGLELYGHAA